MKDVSGIILAAGLGTRLKPSTDYCPKPLIPVAGVEPLFYALKTFYDMGLRRIVVNAHYLPEKIEQALIEWRNLFPGLECRVSIERPEILGTGGAILKIIRDHGEWFRSKGILLQNGDTLSDISRSLLIKDPGRNTFAISLKGEHLKKYKPLWVDSSGAWVGIGSESPAPGSRAAHFLGVHYLCPKSAALLMDDHKFGVRNVDLFNGIYRPLCDDGDSFDSMVFLEDPKTGRFWFDMNTPEFLLEAQRSLMDSLLSSETWLNVLRARFPEVREKMPGIWSNFSEQELSRIDLKPPVILLNAGKGSLGLSKFNHIHLGPYASLLIREQGGSSKKPVGSSRIENSVVMSSSQHLSAFSETVSNRIYVSEGGVLGP